MPFLLLTVLLAVNQSPLPAPAQDARRAPGAEQTAVFAGGCFWGVEAVFERLAGVKDVVSGFAGGTKTTANYELVSAGTTGHAEAVRIKYDPSAISYGRLLQIFFAIAHNPTELNRQGPDEGPQYRSSVFYEGTEQQAIAEAYIKQLNDAHSFARPIVTTVVKLEGFYAADAYHQDFVRRHPQYPYVVVNDLPKLRHLEASFPELLKSK
jgi:peptide-methionine (S)-S-oxide reductase